MTISIGDQVLHLPPDAIIPLSGPLTIFMLLPEDVELGKRYLVLPDQVFHEIELISVNDYIDWKRPTAC